RNGKPHPARDEQSWPGVATSAGNGFSTNTSNLDDSGLAVHGRTQNFLWQIMGFKIRTMVGCTSFIDQSSESRRQKKSSSVPTVFRPQYQSSCVSDTSSRTGFA